MACGGGDATSSTTSNLPTSIGRGEGQLNLIAWEGYTAAAVGQAVRAGDRLQGQREVRRLLRRDGHADAPGRRLAVRHGLGLRRRGAAADPRRRRAAGERRADPRLQELHPAAPVAAAQHRRRQALRRLAAVGPEHAALQHEKVPTAPTSWATIYDPKYKGKVTVPDNPIQIADAALYLSRTRPELGIRDPYALTEDAARRRDRPAQAQRPLIKKYWALASDEIDLFKNGDAVVGASWPYQTITLQDSGAPVKDLIPREGATGWADTWMLSAKAKTPQLRVQVDAVGLDAESAGAAGDLVRRDAREPEGLRGDGQDSRGARARSTTRTRRRRTSTRSVLEDADQRLRRRQARTARTTRPGSRSGRR